jgi:hypothetical protein
VQPWKSSSPAHPLPCCSLVRLYPSALFPLMLCSPPPLPCVLCSARFATRRQGTDLRLRRIRRGAALTWPMEELHRPGGEPLHMLPRELGNDKDQAGAPPSLSIPAVVATATTPGSRGLECPTCLKQGPLGQWDSASTGERAERGTRNAAVD